MRAGVVRHLRQILLQETDIARILVRLTSTVAMIRKDRSVEQGHMLSRRTRPGLVRGPLTDPRLRTAHDAHIAVDEAPRRLFQRYTGLLRTEGGQTDPINRPREHHIAVEHECPRLCRVPADTPDPVLATEIGLGAAHSEVLERIGADAARHVIRGQPGRGLLDRIVSGSGITEDNRIYTPLYGVHETLDDPRFILYHAEENELVVGHY